MISACHNDVVKVIELANKHDVVIIPFGGKFDACLEMHSYFRMTVKPVLRGHSKIHKTKILMTNGSIMQLESIAQCCNTFDLHLGS